MELVYQIRLLGTVQVEVVAEPIRNFRTRKCLALLGYLIRQEGPVSRSHLADLLWTNNSESRGRANLSHELSLLSKRLPGCFQADYHTIQFQPSASYWVDTLAFEGLMAQSRAAGERPFDGVRIPGKGDFMPGPLLSGTASLGTDLRPETLAEAVALYRGDFMAGYYLSDSPEFETWLLREQELWRRRVTQILDRLITCHIQHGQDQQAQLYASHWLALEPWREEAHRQLMFLLARSGNRSAALAQYESCRRLLAEELGVDPAAETVALYEQIRAGELSKGAEAQGDRGENLFPAPPSTGSGRGLPSRTSVQDWGEVPDIGVFYGRQAELAALEQWLVADHCRLVAVLGMGGVGKTALAAKVTQALAAGFECVIWRSLLNAPPFEEILRGCLQFLSAQQITDLPNSLDEQLALLLDQLRQQRCLIVLDNLETILQSGERAGYYRPGYEVYGQLIRRVGETKHQSCLLLTSRERPRGFVRLEEAIPLVRSLQLAGLDTDAGQEILEARGLSGTAEAEAALIERYSGNPLALRLVSQTIHELFEDDIATFLTEETPIFDDIRDVLDQQFARLSTLEQELLTWLAIEREAIGPEQLQTNLVQAPSRRELLERLRALRRRSLLERGATGFTLQNVVMEYVTDRLVEAVGQEIVEGKVTEQLNRYALLKAQAKEYIRASQVRLILQPIIERLQVTYRLEGVETWLKALVTKLRQTAEVLVVGSDFGCVVSGTGGLSSHRRETSGVSFPQPGYAAGNLLNLLLHLKPEVKGLDFSGLPVWQAYLQGMRLREVNFSQADLTSSVFMDTFGVILSVAFSPDGRLLAAGTSDGRVWVWRAIDGQLLLTCEGHTNWVYSVCFSPDGRLLASGSGDQTIRLWEVETGQCLNILQGHTNWVWSVCFSPDGRLLASGSKDQAVRLWEVETGQCLNILQGHTNAVRSVCFNPAGQSLASGSFDGTIRLWDIQTGHCFKILEERSDDIESVSFSLDGQSLASGGGRTIRLWNIQTGHCFRVLEGHTNWVNSVCFSPDGQSLVSSSHDYTIRLWQVATGQCLRILSGHSHWIDTLSLSPNGQTIASGSYDRTIRLWDVSTGQCLRILHGHTNWVSSVCFSPDGQSLVSGGTDQTIHLWKVGTGQHLKTLQGHHSGVWSVCFSPDGQTLASGSQDRTIRLWAVQSGQAFKTLRGHTHSVTSIRFSPDGQTLVSGSGDQSIRLWDVHTGQCLKILQGHTDEVASVCFSPDGQIIASSGPDRTIRLWEVSAGQCLKVLRGHTENIRSVCFSSDGQSLASGSDDRTIRLWDIHTGQCLKILRGHTDEVSTVHFNPDGQSLASGGDDRIIRLWDISTGHCFQTLQEHTATVATVQFSPDGQILASGSDDETIRLWEVKSGVCLKVLRADRPYERLNISGASGLSEAQKLTLKALGAVEE